MKTIASCLILILFLSGCSSSTTENRDTATGNAQSAKINEAAVPVDIDRKFNKLMDEYERKISKSFWTKFTSTTRRGGEGITETTFDQNAYDAFMNKKGFTSIPNTDMGYKGTVDNIDVSILHKSVTGEKGGWIHQWTIDVQMSTDSGTFKKQRNFQIEPS